MPSSATELHLEERHVALVRAQTRHLFIFCRVPARWFPLDKELAYPHNESGTPPACVRGVLGRAKSARPGGKAGLGSLPGKNDTLRVALALGVTNAASSTRNTWSGLWGSLGKVVDDGSDQVSKQDEHRPAAAPAPAGGSRRA